MTARYLGSAAAVALAIGAAPAWSLTAEEAWAGWQAAAEAFDQTVAARSVQPGDGSLTATGVTFSAEADEVTVEGEIERVVFTEQDDGSVRITMSDSYPMTIAWDTLTGESGRAVLEVSQPGLEMIARDVETGARFDYTAPELTVSVTEALAEGETVPITAVITLTGVAGTYATSGAEPRQIENDIAADTVAFDLSMTDTEQGGNVTVEIDVA